VFPPGVGWQGEEGQFTIRCWVWPCDSDERDEFADLEDCLSQDGPQRAAIQLSVIGDDDLGKRIIAPENHVAALLPPEGEADFGECADAFPARDAWEFAHTATTNVSKRSSGTGRLSCSSAAT